MWNIHPLATLIGMPVPLLINAIIQISELGVSSAMHKITQIQSKIFSSWSHQTPEWREKSAARKAD